MLNSWCQALGYRTRRAVPKLGAAVCIFCGLFTALSLAGRLQAQEKPTVHVAAAADLQPVMPALAYAFEKKTGMKLTVSFGSSATLSQQIINGAPFDVFLSADFIFPEKVVAAGLAATAAPERYAKGTLVLFARKDSPLNPLHLELLTDPRVTKIAVADQFHAPFGRAAYAALDKLKILPQVQPKLVTAENVAQTAQLVVSGNAQLGLISLTLASSKAMADVGAFVRVPSVAYPEILQYGVVMKNGPNRAGGEAFFEFIRSREVQDKLHDFGLEAVN